MITIKDFDFSNFDTNEQNLIKKGFNYALDLIEDQNREVIDINQDYKFLSSGEVQKIIEDVKKSVLMSEELKMKKLDYSNKTSEFNLFLAAMLERENEFIADVVKNNKTACRTLNTDKYTFTVDEV